MDDLDALADYIAVLKESASKCHHTEDRPTYARHLAQAALMFYAMQMQKTDQLISIIEAEERTYGYQWLSYEEGELAEHAFWDFARYVLGKYAT